MGDSWIEFADEDLEEAALGRITMLSKFDGPFSLRGIPTLGTPELARATSVLELEAGFANHCLNVADRLIIAKTRRSPANRIVDACICLEMIFGDKQTSEIQYRVALRAALFLATDQAERLHIRSQVTKFYAFRSQVVHGTRSDWSTDDSKLSDECVALVGRSLWSLVDRKKLPRWRDWELAGGDPQNP